MSVAAEAKRRADEAANADARVDYLDMEKRWLALARSYAFTQRLADFTSALSDRIKKPE